MSCFGLSGTSIVPSRTIVFCKFSGIYTLQGFYVLERAAAVPGNINTKHTYTIINFNYKIFKYILIKNYKYNNMSYTNIFIYLQYILYFSFLLYISYYLYIILILVSSIFICITYVVLVMSDMLVYFSISCFICCCITHILHATSSFI